VRLLRVVAPAPAAAADDDGSYNTGGGDVVYAMDRLADVID